MRALCGGIWAVGFRGRALTAVFRRLEFRVEFRRQAFGSGPGRQLAAAVAATDISAPRRLIGMGQTQTYR